MKKHFHCLFGIHWSWETMEGYAGGRVKSNCWVVTAPAAAVRGQYGRDMFCCNRGQMKAFRGHITVTGMCRHIHSVRGYSSEVKSSASEASPSTFHQLKSGHVSFYATLPCKPDGVSSPQPTASITSSSTLSEPPVPPPFPPLPRHPYLHWLLLLLWRGQQRAEEAQWLCPIGIPILGCPGLLRTVDGYGEECGYDQCRIPRTR